MVTRGLRVSSYLLVCANRSLPMNITALTAVRLCLSVLASASLASAAEPELPAREKKLVEGWTVLVSTSLQKREPVKTAKALELLAEQLRFIVRTVPAAAVERLREVPLYLSDEYEGVEPKAEYHPDVRWLKVNLRDPAMAGAVEFTNVRIFEDECRRMPVLALHELAHAYHHRVLGHGQPEILSAYQRAREGGAYDSVQRKDAKGRVTMARAYALTNDREYFAECTESYFGTNDFFPYTRQELATHDPTIFELLGRLWANPPSSPAVLTEKGVQRGAAVR